MNNPKELGTMIIFTLLFVFVLALIGSWLTILSLNTLFAREIIELSVGSVFALAWIKFMIGSLLSGIVRITHQEVKR